MNNATKQCAICGAEFIPKDPRNKFCSLECKEVQRIRNRDKWRDAHPGYETEYMREYRARKKMEQKGTDNENCGFCEK